MSVLEGFKKYYRLFGLHGVYLITKCRLSRTPMEVHVRADGVRHLISLRLHTTDASLFEEIILNEEYRIEHPISPKVIVDAGANIGMTSVYFATRYPDARIFPIEPEAGNFAMLRKNVAPYPNITPIQAALWRNSAPLELSDPGEGDWAFQTNESTGHPSRTSVPGLTIDEMMGRYGFDFVDLLKVDIEGAEKEVFESSEAWIGKVGAIVVELHDRIKSGCSASVFTAAKEFPVRWQKGETTFMFPRDTVTPVSRHIPAGRPYRKACRAEIVSANY